MSENNAVLMALIRSEFKKLREQATTASSPNSLPPLLEERLEAIENAHDALAKELRHRTALIARAIAILHSELPVSEALPDDLLSDDLFSSFMDNYPAAAKPPFDVAKFEALSDRILSWSDDLLAARKAEKEAEIASKSLDPLSAYKAAAILNLINREHQRRANRIIEPDAGEERER